MIVIMKKEMITTGKSPGIGYAGTEGRMVLTFFKGATCLPSTSPKMTACESEAFHNTFDCLSIYGALVCAQHYARCFFEWP